MHAPKGAARPDLQIMGRGGGGGGGGAGGLRELPLGGIRVGKCLKGFALSSRVGMVLGVLKAHVEIFCEGKHPMGRSAFMTMKGKHITKNYVLITTPLSHFTAPLIGRN